jgi:glycosyltransferase involved in cell wall biosynthesis
MAYWELHGVRHISWLPPLAEAAVSDDAARQEEASSTGDVVFLGNLTTPNNIRGVEWLLNEIAPLVCARRPGTTFVIAGSNPGEHVRGLCRSAGAQLLANPLDALAVYKSARVLVNPVRTGSGTQVKAIEMLMTSAPIVTATQGTCGLPPSIKQLFRVANTPQAFADEILAALDEPSRDEPSLLARHTFGVSGLAEALAKAPLGRLQ